jgi:hypothetical protein
MSASSKGLHHQRLALFSKTKGWHTRKNVAPNTYDSTPDEPAAKPAAAAGELWSDKKKSSQLGYGKLV